MYITCISSPNLSTATHLFAIPTTPRGSFRPAAANNPHHRCSSTGDSDDGGSRWFFFRPSVEYGRLATAEQVQQFRLFSLAKLPLARQRRGTEESERSARDDDGSGGISEKRRRAGPDDYNSRRRLAAAVTAVVVPRRVIAPDSSGAVLPTSVSDVVKFAMTAVGGAAY
ncbi:Uncharacterized protein FWK35_00013701, partial [Aphis craccivora]